MPKARTASSPVVGRIVHSGRGMHSRIVGGRRSSVTPQDTVDCRFDLNFVNDRYLPEKLKHPETFLP